MRDVTVMWRHHLASDISDQSHQPNYRIKQMYNVFHAVLTYNIENGLKTLLFIPPYVV